MDRHPSPCSLSTLVQPPCTGLALSTSTVVRSRSNISTSTTLSTPVSRSLGRSVHLRSRNPPDRHHQSGSKFARCNCGQFPIQPWILYAPASEEYQYFSDLALTRVTDRPSPKFHCTRRWNHRSVVLREGSHLSKSWLPANPTKTIHSLLPIVAIDGTFFLYTFCKFSLDGLYNLQVSASPAPAQPPALTTTRTELSITTPSAQKLGSVQSSILETFNTALNLYVPPSARAQLLLNVRLPQRHTLVQISSTDTNRRECEIEAGSYSSKSC